MSTEKRVHRLVLKRNKGQSVLIGDTRVTMLAGHKVQIEAPKEVRVIREELVETFHKDNGSGRGKQDKAG